MRESKESRNILTVITGELSGETHASNLIDRLSEIGRFQYFSMGGELLREKTELIFDYRKISVTGFTEIFRRAGSIIRAYLVVKRHLETLKPLATILVDFPGFNLRIADISRKLGIPVFYFIPPQVWAWGKKRLKKIKRSVDLVISFFPFEKELYDSYGIKCEFVGHPYTKLKERVFDREAILRSQSIPSSKTIIGILPGSRDTEIRRHIKVISSVIDELKKKLEDAIFVISAARTVDCERIKRFFAGKEDVRVLEDSSLEILSVSSCAIVSSGSATLEASLLGVPTVVIYKLSTLSYLIARVIVKVPYVSLPNIILNEEIFPEFIQRIEPAKIADKVIHMLKNDERERVREKSRRLYDLLSYGDSYMLAARKIVDRLREIYGSLP